jgi:release factor glutamine methyltransferase
VGAALRAAASRLAAAGIATPELDAELLLRHVLGWDRATLLTRKDGEIAAPQLQRYEALVGERALRRPLQHLVGTQAFWRHEFRVTPDVLIPRPETEILVEAALERLRPLARPRIVDVGTGSGCIALSLAAELPAATVFATDVSAPALRVARDNARRLGLEGRVTFHEGDLLGPVAAQEPFDLIASNPPYVDPADLSGLAPEVRDHEPRIALVPPDDEPLSVYRRLVPQGWTALKPGGWLILEIDVGRADDVREILLGRGFTLEPVEKDLQQIPRVLIAQRPRRSPSRRAGRTRSRRPRVPGVVELRSDAREVANPVAV